MERGDQQQAKRAPQTGEGDGSGPPQQVREGELSLRERLASSDGA
jgi:hypothetical protein